MHRGDHALVVGHVQGHAEGVGTSRAQLRHGVLPALLVPGADADTPARAPSPAAISYPIPLFAPVTSAIVFSFTTASMPALRPGTNTYSVVQKYPNDIDQP
ncbi:hypothetical protein SANT12839_022970 [Streptomyces antimycoticus]|uniref:Uncharacterized protein n=1 Tax=Streptomyces antimycoticus TaxID=68175 RepID=A0A4D4JXL2_9ACTN|nr:hypothetical protein SANT12839_022970 [Streptomyces antimycoticus]